jgi:arylsulfatase A-like enzyme
MIQADDLGYDDLGVHGNRLIETPNIDRLAGESVRFSQFYVTPVCATTRASLLTGRHFLRTGVSHVHGGKDFLHTDETTIAEVLAASGYVTGIWGKWHAGKTCGYFPWDRGFDEAFMARLYDYQDNEGKFNGSTLQTEGWITKVITDFAIEFISEHQDGPFFAYVSYLACHEPLEAPEAYRNKYLDKGLSENLATLYGMIDHMDHHVGRLLDTLDELNLSENTVVFFMSDNGPAILNRWLTDQDRETRYVNRLRGHKGNNWDNGIRSPLFVRLNGTYKPGMVHQLVDITDIFPTVAGLARVDADLSHYKLDGSSFVSYLEGDTANPGKKEIFLYANPGWPPTQRPWTPEGVKDEYRPLKYSGGDELDFEKQIIGLRTNRYKLLLNPGTTDGTVMPDDAGYVLIDMIKDPGEDHNIIGANNALFRQMNTRMKEWYESVFFDQHSFGMPVFQISADTLCASDVPAYAPRRISKNVSNAFNYITRFISPGDYGIYDLNVITEGEYDLYISYQLEGKNTVDLMIDIAGNKRTVSLHPGLNGIEVEHLCLAGGKQEMKVENQKENQYHVLRLFNFRFDYRHENNQI